MKMKYSKKIMVSALISAMAVSMSAEANPQRDFNTTFSPDGKRLAFYSYRDKGLPDIYISDNQGGHEVQLTKTDELWEIQPDWSPDGKFIAYSAGPSMKDLEIYSIRPDGSDLKQLTDGEGSALNVNWHPTRQAMLYSRYKGEQNSDIFYLDLQTGKEYPMVIEKGDKYQSAHFSNDGERIVFVKHAGDKNELIISDPHFKHVQPLKLNGLSPRMTSWAPGDKGLVFSATGSANTHDLYYVDIESGKVEKITDVKDKNIYFSAFTPDGKSIYFDQGDWSANFFTYKSDWPRHSLKPVQVSGKDWIDTIALMEEAFLSPMIGKWKGVSTHGQFEGRFEEVVEYKWGPNNKSILVDMELYWDGEKYGEASGLLGLDTETQKVFYNLVMDDGTVVMQEQNNPGEAGNWEMMVRASGDGRRYPNSFKVNYVRQIDGTWKTDILRETDGEWTVMDVHEFSPLTE